MRANDDMAQGSFKRSLLHDWLVVIIWAFSAITLFGGVLGGILLKRIGGTTSWSPPGGSAEQVEIHTKDQVDKFVTSILITVQNQPMGQAAVKADMVFIASFNALQQRLTMVALANETVLNVEGQGKKTLGETYELGGPGLLINTINQNFNLDLQKYACTDMNALAVMLDILGGAQVELTLGEASYINYTLSEAGADVNSGQVTLNGIESMVYAMDNYSGKEPLGNLTRSLTLVNSVVSNMRKSATKEAMLPLLSLVFSSIKTNLDFEALRELGYEILKAEEIEYGRLILPSEGSYRITGITRDRLEIDIPTNSELLYDALYNVSGEEG